MQDYWNSLFDTTSFVPRAICGTWTPELRRLHNYSDLLIFWAYVAIPVVLVSFALRRRRDLPFKGVFWVFGLFIISCGATHYIDYLMFTYPIYRFGGVVKAVTAFASWAAVLALIPIVPRALALRSPEELEAEVEERRRAEAGLKEARDELEQRVRERTEELERVNAELRREIEQRELAGAALRESEDKFRRVVENTQDLTTIIDGDGTVRYESPAIERMLGYTADELVGRNAFDLVHPDDLAYTHDTANQVVGSTGPGTLTQFRFKHKNGEWRTLEVNGSSFSDGGEQRLLLSSRDVTERKETEERLRLLESVAVHSNDAILITEAEPVDLPGPRILYANEAFMRTTGYALDEIVGRTPRLLQGENTNRASLDKIRSALEAWEPVVVEMINYAKDGREFWVELSIAPVANESGWYTHWISVQRDITERKQNEIVLTQAIAEAERARTSAERANQAKSEFLSRMSHELRTPLNAILGFAQLLEMDVKNAEDRESTDQILKAGRHLLDLINEVLDISRIESGRLALSMEPVNCQSLLIDVVNLTRPLSERFEVSIAFNASDDIDRYILADSQRIKQVLLNLMSNAVKYNHAGGSVTLNCVPLERNLLRIAVTNTGQGITTEQRERLFTPFDRLGAERTTVEGTGIGLALSLRLMEAMGSTIEVESEAGQGATFSVTMKTTSDPLARLEEFEQHSDAVTASDEAVARHTILYIEDNLSNLRLVERIMLQRPGIRLLAAMQGLVGLELAREHAPELIFLDLHLPDIRGDEVLQRLRSDEVTRDIPVVMISADATPSQRERLMVPTEGHSGAHTYLTKPLDVREFLNTMDAILSGEVEGKAEGENEGYNQ